MAVVPKTPTAIPAALASVPPMDSSIVRRPPFGTNPVVGARGTDTRRRVLAAALEVFGEMAYAEARVELITERAGCSRPAFYQYFSSKDDVFWALASELGHEMVALAEQLDDVTPDRAGLDRLVLWIDDFMALHQAWAPVFDSYPAASRGFTEQVRGSSAISGRTGRALLRAAGASDAAADLRIVTNLVAVLIRCSFFAEHAPSGMSRRPMVVGLAHVFHRVLLGPVDGVNVVRGRPSRRRRIKITAPAEPSMPPELPARGEHTRQRLLDAGATVLPQRGYHDARVDDIVTEAGVSHGTFYRYFENKDDFFRVLAEGASTRMIELVDRLDLNASPEDLRAWITDWFDAYEADGGIISTWQEMRASAELAAFSQQVGAAAFTRLERLLDQRDFGEPQVDAATFLALIERGPYSVYTLRFSSRDDAIEAMAVVIERGYLGLDDEPPVG